VAGAPLPDQAYAVFVRSPHAFTDIISIETSNALRAPGVLAVLTGADLDAVIADAIPSQAAACIDMPATPERLWRACSASQDARRDANARTSERQPRGGS